MSGCSLLYESLSSRLNGGYDVFVQTSYLPEISPGHAVYDAACVMMNKHKSQAAVDRRPCSMYDSVSNSQYEYPTSLEERYFNIFQVQKLTFKLHELLLRYRTF